MVGVPAVGVRVAVLVAPVTMVAGAVATGVGTTVPRVVVAGGVPVTLVVVATGVPSLGGVDAGGAVGGTPTSPAGKKRSISLPKLSYSTARSYGSPSHITEVRPI